MTAFNVEYYMGNEGVVRGSIYKDPDIFKREMNRIFSRGWVYVGHETELPEPGDYKTSFVGTRPIVISRGADDGKLRALYNRCRHRGATVCQESYGNSNVFRCAYHGWTYKNSGELVGAPMPQGFGPDFDKSELGLTPAGRIDSFEGFIFVNLSEEGAGLQDYLGQARPYLERIANSGTNGIEVRKRAQKLTAEGNWKLQLENTIDPYHVMFVHRTYIKLLEQRTGEKSTWTKNVKENPNWEGIDLGNGHAVHEYGGGEGHSLDLGDLPFNLVIFPNLGFVGTHVRVIRPIGPNKTIVMLHPFLLKDAASDVNGKRLRSHESFYGPAGFGSPDDNEVAFIRVQNGLEADGQDDLLVNRGLHRQVSEEGLVHGRSSDDVPIRAMHRQWKRMMEEE